MTDMAVKGFAVAATPGFEGSGANENKIQSLIATIRLLFDQMRQDNLAQFETILSREYPRALSRLSESEFAEARQRHWHDLSRVTLGSVREDIASMKDTTLVTYAVCADKLDLLKLLHAYAVHVRKVTPDNTPPESWAEILHGGQAGDADTNIYQWFEAIKDEDPLYSQWNPHLNNGPAPES